MNDKERDRKYHREWNREYRKNNLEKVRAREREYAREWRVKNRERFLETRRQYSKQQKYQQSMTAWRRNNPKKMREYVKEWCGRNGEKVRAERQARKMPLNSHCSKCRGTIDLERHHEDYSKPLEVVTLCRSCHISEHRG
jgi:hypothetical protein